MPMQAVDTVFVTSNEAAKKRFPQGGGWGVGVRRFLGEEKGKMNINLAPAKGVARV